MGPSRVFGFNLNHPSPVTPSLTTSEQGVTGGVDGGVNNGVMITM